VVCLIAVVIVMYFVWLAPVSILLRHTADHSDFQSRSNCRQYGVAWFGIRVNTFANSLRASPPCAASPIPFTARRASRHEHRLILISVELF